VKRKKKCKRCDQTFSPKQWNQVFCGSKIKKTGCSWFNVTVTRSKRRWQNENYKNYQREYGKKWKIIQRKLNSEYAQKQLELKREYGRSVQGKIVAQKWRKENMDKILFWNKKRILLEKNVPGSHTWYEWQELKVRHNNKCAICKINEIKLKRRWGNKFSKLTEDHIVPISKGGTDYISNIQPLCISCNAKKKDN